ncbi:MAG: hypothetical protein M1820_001594 [Bogoriella megaspora]|nr:MAG: hypothetical protein M1820_001594 [Bogoriella megaspora]
MLNLQEFPHEILISIAEQLVRRIGIYKAVSLRSVNRAFNSAILHAICHSEVLSIDDCATPYLARRMAPTLKGRILLTRLRSKDVRNSTLLHVLATVNRALDNATKPESQEQRIKQHQMIAEAVALKHRDQTSQTQNQFRHIDAKVQAQNVFSGAIVLGNLQLVKELLQLRSPELVDENVENPYFGRPLQIAATWGHLQIVEYLLACGANPRVCDDDQDWESDREIYVGDPYIYRHSEGSPLRAAVLGGHEAIANLLLEPKHRISITSMEYVRAVVAGARNGHLHTLEKLIEPMKKSLSDMPRLQREILWEAACHDQIAIVKMVLDSGVDIDIAPLPDCFGHGCALSIAASAGKAHMVQFLLDNGADANFSHLSQRKFDPIEIASHRGHEEVVDKLLERGADSVRAFIHATDRGQARLVNRLHTRDPSLHTKIWDWDYTAGFHALRQAIATKNPDVIKLLVGIGVPLNEGYEYLDLPIITAKMYAAEWIVDLLLSLGAKDEELNEENLFRRDEGYSEEDLSKQMVRGGVRITKRTWEWVSKY